MIGSGIFLLPASLALYGAISIIGWLCSAAGAVVLAILFGNLSQLVPDENGGPYAYAKVSFGRLPAFLVAWGYWISIWATNAAITVALVGYLSVFFPILATNSLAAIAVGLGFIWTLTWVNTKEIIVVGRVQLWTTILKLVPIFLVGLVGVFYLDLSHFRPFNLSDQSTFSAITATTTLTLFAFLGMESATIPSTQIKNNESTIRKATLTGTLVSILVYILASVAIMGILPPEELASSSAPFADASERFWGPAARYFVAGGAVIATLGALNGWLLIQGQIPMIAAGDQLFPKVFGKTNDKGSPTTGMILSSILVSGLMMLNYSKSLVAAFTFMMTLSTLSVLTPYLFSSASYFKLVRNGNGSKKGKQQCIAVIAFIFSLWIIVGCGTEVLLWGLGLLFAGLPVYAYLEKGRRV